MNWGNFLTCPIRKFQLYKCNLFFFQGFYLKYMNEVYFDIIQISFELSEKDHNTNSHTPVYYC